MSVAKKKVFGVAATPRCKRQLDTFLNSDILKSSYKSGGEKMQAIKSAIGEIKSRGQLTIPKKIREISHLAEGQVVSIIPVGDSIIITPNRLELDEARKQIKKILRESGLSLEEVLAGLEEERAALYEETYGKQDL